MPGGSGGWKNKRILLPIAAVILVLVAAFLLLSPRRTYVGLKDTKWAVPKDVTERVVSAEDVRETMDLNRFEVLYVANVKSMNLMTSMLRLGGLLDRMKYPGDIVITADPCVVLINNRHKTEINGDVYCIRADDSVFKEIWPRTKEYGAYYEKGQPTIIYISDDAVEAVVLYSDGIMRAFGTLSTEGWKYGGENVE